MNTGPFSGQAKCFNIAVTTTASGSVALPGVGDSIRLVNEGPNVCYVAIGSGAQTATLPSSTAATTCTPVLAGTDVTFGIPWDATLQISAITRSGTATLNVQVGTGL